MGEMKVNRLLTITGTVIVGLTTILSLRHLDGGDKQSNVIGDLRLHS
jgi:hypothetical protein